jgi:hypothetical protein
VGTLGVEAFANDDALDWLLELDPADGVRPVLAALERAAGAIDPHLDAHTAAVALAAAELLAALRGRRVEAEETDALLARYGEWQGLASVYLLAGWGRGLVPVKMTPPQMRQSRIRTRYAA